MKILLTGSSGFIGSYFKQHYSHLHTIQTFSFLNDNLKALDLTGTEAVVHLSALVHQMNDASEEEYERINLFQTVELAEKAKECGVGHFIFMSTVKVYGEETNLPYNENSACLPEDNYGKSKLRAEEALQTLSSEDFIVSIIRTPIVYGYGVKANIKSLIRLVQNISIIPFDGIDNKRSIVYIGNLSYLIHRVIQQQRSGIFLASDDAPISTTNLIQYISKAMHKEIILVKIPFFTPILRLVKPSYHKRLFESLEVDNTATKNRLQLTNPYTTEEGIYNMLHGESK